MSLNKEELIAIIAGIESSGIKARPVDVAKILGISNECAAQRMRRLSRDGLIKRKVEEARRGIDDGEIDARVEAIRRECGRLGRQMSTGELDGFLDSLENEHQ